MIHFGLLTVALTATYLLVLTSVHPGDVLVGAVLSALIALAMQRVAPARAHPAPPLRARLVAFPPLLASALAAIVRGAGHVAGCCLAPRRIQPAGVVAIPTGDGSPSGVALSGIMAGLSPDGVVVDVDDERGVLLVHVLDTDDAERVRSRHLESYERQRRVWP
jgi:multisubunit Na+/H+ antiporter MnhE subunit